MCFSKVGNFNKEVYCSFTVGHNSMFLHWNVANLQLNYQTYKINKIKQNNGRHLQLISVPGLCKNKKCWEKNSFLKLNYANWGGSLGSRRGWVWQLHPQHTEHQPLARPPARPLASLLTQWSFIKIAKLTLYLAKRTSEDS